MRSLILAEEERFQYVPPYRSTQRAYALDRRTLASEIDDIRAGRWDNEIAQELGITSQNATSTAPQPQEYSVSVHPLDTVESLLPQETDVVDNESQQGRPGGQIQV